VGALQPADPQLVEDLDALRMDPFTSEAARRARIGFDQQDARAATRMGDRRDVADRTGADDHDVVARACGSHELTCEIVTMSPQ
jgi:hypothetical protein